MSEQEKKKKIEEEQESPGKPEPENQRSRQGKPDAPTEREREREREDQKFVPVILKRTDEARRHPDDILEHAINEGLEQLKRPFGSLALSAAAAGLILGFTAMSVGVVTTALAESLSPMLLRIAQALVYPFGFVVCIVSGTELFTEHTATAVYPILDRKASAQKLLRLWTVVLFGNLVGAFFSSLLLTAAEPVIQATPGYEEIGKHLISYDWPQLLASALLAGWLMALGGWLVLATPTGVSQIVSIYIVTFMIGLGGLHHSIAGSVEIFTALLLTEHIPLAEALSFIGFAALGNVLGGSLFVALLNYGHIRQSQ